MSDFLLYHTVCCILSEVREGVIPSALLSQDCFGYSGSFVFPYKFKNCSSSVKNFDRCCIESIDFIGLYVHFNNIESSNLRKQYIFLCVYIVFNFFHQHLIVFRVQVCASSGGFIPRYFFLFDMMVNGIFSLISLYFVFSA